LPENAFACRREKKLTPARQTAKFCDPKIAAKSTAVGFFHGSARDSGREASTQAGSDFACPANARSSACGGQSCFQED
jgi:hypothetical protein